MMSAALRTLTCTLIAVFTYGMGTLSSLSADDSIQTRRPANALRDSGEEQASRLSDENEHLISAVINGDRIGVRTALARGAHVETHDLQGPGAGETPLIRAALTGDTVIIRLLLNRGAQVNARDKDGDTALLTAAAMGHTAVVKMLLAAGAEVNTPERRGLTALHVAADRANIPLLRLLIKHGARQSPARNGFTPLMLAAKHRSATAAFLLANGARVNARTKSGTTALMIAATAGQPETFHCLLAAGADPEMRRSDGASALSFAIRKLYPYEAPANIIPIARTLLQRGLSPNERSGSRNRTPLLIHAIQNYWAYGAHGPDIIKLLLDFGADPTATGAFDQTAHEAALKMRNDEELPSELLERLYLPETAEIQAELSQLTEIIYASPEQTEEVLQNRFQTLLRPGGASPRQLLDVVCGILSHGGRSINRQHDPFLGEVLQRLIELSGGPQDAEIAAYLRSYCVPGLDGREYPTVWTVAFDSGIDPDPHRFRAGIWPEEGSLLKLYLERSPRSKNRGRIVRLYLGLARAGSMEGMRAILESGVDPGSTDERGEGALDYALRGFERSITPSAERQAAIRFLESSGVSLRKPEEHLCSALNSKNTFLINYIKTRHSPPANPDCYSPDGLPLLYELILTGDQKGAALARKAGMQDPAADLMAAVLEGDLDEIRRLLTTGAPVYDATLLHALQRYSDLERSPLLERFLFRLRRSPVPAWWDGETPVLNRAAKLSNFEASTRALSLLLERGFSPDTIGLQYHLESPLRVALRDSKNSEAVRILLEGGANPDYRTAAAFSPEMLQTMELAAIHPDPKVLRLMLLHGGRASTADRDGHSLLMRAANFRDAEMACMLRQAGADPDARRNDGIRAIDLVPERQQKLNAEPDARPDLVHSMSPEEFNRLRKCLAPR